MALSNKPGKKNKKHVEFPGGGDFFREAPEELEHHPRDGVGVAVGHDRAESERVGHEGLS